MNKVYAVLFIVFISTLLNFINIKTVYSNWIPLEKSNNTFTEADQSQLSNAGPDISDEQMLGFLDENGEPIFSKNDFSKTTDDSLQSDAISERIMNGLTAGDYFGSSVSGAGDVNGDGYEDVIVGAPYSDYTGTNSGRAYIYFGGAVFNSTPDKILSGVAGDLLGFSVSSAGDVNGDGFDDVIVSMQGFSTYTGRAYIYYGGADMNTTADVTLTGQAANDYFGYSVSDAGDVNGDGFADVIIGAPFNSLDIGKAYIYYGGSSMNSVVDVTLNAGLASSYFGFSVSSAGDFNGDGYSDVITGAYGYNTSQGRVFIYLGGSSMNNIADMALTGIAIYDNFGVSVSSAGDFNGDGYSDFIVGSYGYSNSTGRVYLYLGGAVINSTVDITFTGQNTGQQFGKSVSGTGDYNGDGYDDIIIGASSFSAGTGYIFNGSNSLDNNVDKILSAEYADDSFASAVSGCGDVNGDGNSDFIIGASFNDQNGASSGRAYIYFNSMSGSDIEDLSFTGAAADNYLGSSVAYAGDVNGDGYDDIIVGAYGYNAVQGRAYIYLGGGIMNNVADVTLTGVSAGDKFGVSVSTAGDVNGDGFSDVIIGAKDYSSYKGRAYIYFGGSTMNNGIDVTFTGSNAGDRFGASVSTAGDVNGDGFSDVIVGAFEYNALQGRAYIYYGGSSMNNTVDVTLTGTPSIDQFGYSVSTAGDVNGDGYGDVIIGSNTYNSGQGRASVYFGGSSMDNNADVIFTNALNFEYFGNSVSKAGDVNGDGYDDIIVGALGYNANQGRAYIYFGGSSMNSTSDVTFTGKSSGDLFGTSVSTAGDINGDGFSDVIVGAPDYGPEVGQAYVYFGNVSMNNTEDIVYTGEINFDQLGFSVSGAGDVNGDGLSDVIVGAHYNDDGGSYAGKAYLYFSTPPVVKPRIVSVKDVPFDQGGFVNLKWIRSGYDNSTEDLITGYLVERSSPPGTGGFSWTNITTIPVTVHNPSYEYQAALPNDSMSGNSGVYFFRITALTVDGNQYWSSNIMSGYSVDNISPLAPANLTAFPDVNSVYLSWNANTESDMHHYNVYRNGIFLSESPGNNFDDLTVLDDSIYNYTVAAVDIHGNESPLSNIVNVNYNFAGTLNLTVVMEGFYNSASNTMSLSDTAVVYLRNSGSPYAIVDSAKGIINSNTFTGYFKLFNTPTGSYYIEIKHRNTIETWSSTAVSYTALSTINYNFSNLSTKAFGNNQIQVDASPVRFAIYSGDVNQDGIVDLTDMSLIFNDGLIFASGYLPTDLNGDSIVDVADAVFADNNAFNFVGKITP
ncbi:MAG: FG-GAP-like repeat-containing protein [Ignavibacteria bacterium]